MKVLIFGGSGFIGSSLVKKFHDNGCFVKVAHNGSFARNIQPCMSTPVQYNLDGFKKILRENFDLIFFFSGNPSPSFSENSPYIDIDLTTRPYLELLDALNQTQFRGSLFFASSVAVYGSNNNPPQSEDSPCNPISFYGAAKRFAEWHGSIYAAKYGLSIGSLRIFSTFGENLKRQVVYDLTKKILLSSKKVEVYGTGNEIRDMNYVENQVNIIFSLAKSIRPNGETYNVGSGQSTTISELYNAICMALNKYPEPKYTCHTRSYDGVTWVADMRLVNSLVSYESIGFVESISKTCTVYEKHLKI